MTLEILSTAPGAYSSAIKSPYQQSNSSHVAGQNFPPKTQTQKFFQQYVAQGSPPVHSTNRGQDFQRFLHTGVPRTERIDIEDEFNPSGHLDFQPQFQSIPSFSKPIVFRYSEFKLIMNT